MFTFGKIQSYNQHRVTSENLWGKQKLKLLKLMILRAVRCLKKHANFETVQLEIIRIDFDGIWQKYSKYSRTEFVCFMLQFLCRFVFLSTYNFELYRFKFGAFFETRCKSSIVVVVIKGELNPKIKLDLNDFFCPLINKYNPHIF